MSLGNGIEFKYRSVDAQAAPHPPPLTQSGYSYFTEQAIRAGYMAPDFGRMHENIQNPLLSQEAIQRELEKERIREQIIVSEITRRRLLEAEVRGEIMLERELALRERGCDVFRRISFVPGAGMMFEPSDHSFRRGEGWSLEERIVKSLEERFGNGTRREIGGPMVAHFEKRSVESKVGAVHDMIPLQHMAVEPKIEDARLPSEVSKAKEKIVFLAKPEQNLSGVKRKSLTPPEEGKGELPLIGVSERKVKEEWICAICKVNATSERGLNEHIQGKKHKVKETALMAQRNGKNFGIGMWPKKTAKAPVLGATTNNSCSEQGEKSVVQLFQSEQTRESLLQNVNEVPPMGVISKDEVLEADSQIQSANKKKEFKFWCEMCRVGAYSVTVMEAHRTGKKHAMRLQEATKNKTVPTRIDSTEAKCQ